MRLSVPHRRADADPLLGEASDAVVLGAFSAARKAGLEWTRKSVQERCTFLRALRGLVADHALELARASAAARQRPEFEALTSEVLPLVEACRFLETQAISLLRPRTLGRRGLPVWLSGVESVIHRDPFGVVLIVGPGNYPLLLPGVQILQALIAGNSVVVKPGVGGREVLCHLREFLVQSGLNPDLCAVLPESVEVARQALELGADKVVFTGSAATGIQIQSELGPRLIPSTMELSGSDAVIVRADADVDLTARALAFGVSLNGGATCLAPKRVYVHFSVAVPLERALAQRLRDRHSEAPPRYPQTAKPFASAASDSLKCWIQEDLSAGARVVCGDVDTAGRHGAPLILADVPADGCLPRRELFAPVLVIISVLDDREAVLRANDSPYGLGASIFSKDEAVARRLASELRVGSVCINDLILPTADPRVPFGGRGRSGWGVTRGAEGLLEMTHIKVVSASHSRFRPAYDAPHPEDQSLMQEYLRARHASSWAARFRAMRALVRLIGRRASSLAPHRNKTAQTTHL